VTINNKNDLQKESLWHTLEASEAFSRLQSDQTGLSSSEAQKRLETYGPNRLPAPPQRSLFIRFISQFNNVLIYVLLGAAVITALLADWVDAGVIIAVVLINGIIGFLQEGKAEKAVDAIRKILTNEALVLRDGNKQAVPVETLVPGDIIYLSSGDKVPADLLLFQCKNLKIEEAALTGESVPAEKSLTPVAEDTALGDRNNMAFSGTMVSFGQGVGVVIATGAKTEIGKVSTLLAGVETLKTRLTQSIDEFSKWLTGAILVLSGLTFVFGWLLRDYTFNELFFASVALAVAAIPEGLPAIITITLALGVQRMARHKAIIRRLPAVENLGSVTIICSDKTGTLTRNEMTVTTIVQGKHTYQVEGVGYKPQGSFVCDTVHINPTDQPDLVELIRGAQLCNDGALLETNGQWTVQGDPTDGALLTLAEKASLPLAQSKGEFPQVDHIPFESEHKFMVTLHKLPQGGGVIYLKGAPERVLERCTSQRVEGVDEPLDMAYWHTQLEAIARQGKRTLAVAVRPHGIENGITMEDVSSDMTLLGIFGLIDPPREEAIAAVKSCHSAGITVKMITGDHALTATAIGEQIGLDTKKAAITGIDIETMDDDQLQFFAKKTNIFARVSPEHKLRLVTALQAGGEVTAMTGDGINDAPALKRADIGVAMGHKGTEAAKEAAEMVLADDNFASIVHAVKEGRTVYDNIRKTLAFILPTNGAQAGIIIASVMMGIALPITSLQILWINMVTAVTLGLCLAFEPAEQDVMHRSPRDPNEPLLTQFLSWRIVFISTIMVIGTLGLFLWDIQHGETLQMARTTAVNTLIFFQIFYLFNARYMSQSVLSKEGLLGNPAVLIAVAGITVLQILFTYLPPFQAAFGTASIPLSDWATLILFTASIFVLVEMEKYIVRRSETNKT